MLLIIVTMSDCSPRVGQSPTPISRIKALRKTTAPEKFGRIDKEYVVEGYFYMDAVPMLLTDLTWSQVNTPMPDSVFIVLNGPALDSIKRNPDRYQGTYMRLKGRINNPAQKMTGRDSAGNNPVQFDIDFICPELPEILRQRPQTFIPPKKFILCQLNPRLCRPSPVRTRNYALLYSGGVNAVNAHSRYWNDLKFMYNTLKSQYGYTDEQIVVVYKAGAGEDSDMTVDYAASPAGMTAAFTFLSSKLNRVSDLFVFVTNHGGGYHKVHGGNESGVADGMPADEIDAHKIDETIFYYNQASNTVTDDQFTTRINALNFRRLVAVFEPCFSGGFLYDLRGSNRIIISASSEFEYSWSGGPGNHDIFSYYFTAALNKAGHDGGAVNADTNSDGKISILEAFLYAKAHDTADEKPHLEDTGDGTGSNSPSAAVGSDGHLSSGIFL